MAWPAAVLPCFISRFLYRPLSVYRLPGGVAATVGAVQPLMVVFIALLALFGLGLGLRRADDGGCGWGGRGVRCRVGFRFIRFEEIEHALVESWLVGRV